MESMDPTELAELLRQVRHRRDGMLLLVLLLLSLVSLWLKPSCVQQKDQEDQALAAQLLSEARDAAKAVSASRSTHKIWTMLHHDGPDHLGIWGVSGGGRQPAAVGRDGGGRREALRPAVQGVAAGSAHPRRAAAHEKSSRSFQLVSAKSSLTR